MLLAYRYATIAVIVVVLVATIVGCGNDPVAVVDGVKITEEEFNERLVKGFGQDTLRDMIDRELFRQAAEEKGVEVTDTEIQEELDRAKQQFPSEEAFNQWLASRNMSQQELEDHVRMAVLTRKLALHDVNPTDEELKAFFESNKERFNEPPTVAYSEIVVSSEEDAQEVLDELEAGDGSFADLARQYSLARSRDAGGEQREMPISSIPVPEIREAAQTVPVGEVSDPIAAQGQWYIIKVRDRQAAREASWEDDRERVLEAYKMANAVSLQEIREQQIENARVQIVDPRFQGLNEDYTPVPSEVPQFGTEEQEGVPLPQEDQPEGAVPQPQDAPVESEAPPAGE